MVKATGDIAAANSARTATFTQSLVVLHGLCRGAPRRATPRHTTRKKVCGTADLVLVCSLALALQARIGIQSAVASECLTIGCHAVDRQAIACFTDVACQYLTALARTAAECAAHHGRTDATIDDVAVGAIAVHANPNAAADIAAFVARRVTR